MSKIKKITEKFMHILHTRPVCVISAAVAVAVYLWQLLMPEVGQTRWSDSAPDLKLSMLEGTVYDYGVYDGYYGEETVVLLRGVVSLDDNGMYTDVITKAGQYIRVYLSPDIVVSIGQRIRVKGRISLPEHATNPGQFDACDFYHNRGMLFNLYDSVILATSHEYSPFLQALHELKTGGETILDRFLDGEDAGIVKAMLYGDRAGIDEDTGTLFRKNGIAHILAISGLHISFMAMLVYNILGRLRFKMWLRSALSGMIIIFYGIMIGFGASAMRAICMFCIYLSGKVLKRTYDMLSAMSAALIAVMILRPTMLADTGLQLSYLAVLGIGFFYESFDKNICRVSKLLSSACVSMFIFLATLPVVLGAYYEVAFYSVFLNLIIIPLMSVIIGTALVLTVTGGIYCVCADLVTGHLALICARIIEIILRFYKWLCRILMEYMPGRVNIGAPRTWQVVLFYILLCLAVSYKGRRRVVLSVCTLMTAVAMLIFKPVSGLDMWMLDVGQGDCMVLRYSAGMLDPKSVYIIDCGSSSSKSVGKKRLIPMLKYYGTDRINAIFITHPDADHINGLAELVKEAADENLRIDNIYVYEGFVGDEALMPFIEAGYRLTGIHGGMHMEDGELAIDVLYPERSHVTYDANDASLVMDIGLLDFNMLTTGDVGMDGEHSITDMYPEPEYDYTILKVAHHGSKGSSSDDILEWADPKMSVISCGRRNSYGHPHDETLDRLTAHGSDVYRTDEYGAVHIHTDGKSVILINE